MYKRGNINTIIVNVYGPHKDVKKKDFWESLENLLRFVNEDWVLCGNFNDVRSEFERRNCVLDPRRAALFNEFINNAKLIEIPLVGKQFTKICDRGMKFSKLDRFLVTEQFLNRRGDVFVTAFERKDTDHCPLAMKNKWVDFGPKPTRIFDEWLDHPEAGNIIHDAWNVPIEINRDDLIFCRNLKAVRMAHKNWSKNLFGKIDSEIEEYKKLAASFELKAETNDLSEAERLQWMDICGQWFKKEAQKLNMMKQKSRFKWVSEGEENIKFFHSFIKRRNCKNNICGIYVNDTWEEDSEAVKAEIFDFF
ncbi:uncharacterized protein [Rutidosis leptorrhynchoides]|uniref:uncharacterized protein n=1 Tax=Rutidosis leptorrhynchoides TaxID=125765 RepID=UPI003A99B0F1